MRGSSAALVAACSVCRSTRRADPDRDRAAYATVAGVNRFNPVEDQGYLLAAVQLPVVSALDRTSDVMDQVQESPPARRRGQRARS